MYAIIQHGGAIWGCGDTIESAIADANEWLDNESQISQFEAHDQLGALGGLTDWTNGRRYQVASGEMLITDNADIIKKYQRLSEGLPC